jgi:hypothetical protein
MTNDAPDILFGFNLYNGDFVDITISTEEVQLDKHLLTCEAKLKSTQADLAQLKSYVKEGIKKIRTKIVSKY